RVLWGGLSLLRVLWCLLPQTGYVHPDEFFQSPEVMAGSGRSWGRGLAW
ncbi:PIGZ isoform 2, partial [Pan troglodytes]